jgi:hypothetical protein
MRKCRRWLQPAWSSGVPMSPVAWCGRSLGSLFSWSVRERAPVDVVRHGLRPEILQACIYL